MVRGVFLATRPISITSSVGLAKKLSVAGNDVVHSRAINIIVVNGLCILGLKGGKAIIVVWPLHIEPSTRNVKTEADGVLDPSLRQWVKRLIRKCLHQWWLQNAYINDDCSSYVWNRRKGCYYMLLCSWDRKDKSTTEPFWSHAVSWLTLTYPLHDLTQAQPFTTPARSWQLFFVWSGWQLCQCLHVGQTASNGWRMIFLIPGPPDNRCVESFLGWSWARQRISLRISHGMLGSLTLAGFVDWWLMVEKKKTAMWDLRLLRCLVGCNDCLMATAKGRNFGVIHKPEGSHMQEWCIKKASKWHKHKHKMLASPLSDLCTAASSANGDCYAHMPWVLLKPSNMEEVIPAGRSLKLHLSTLPFSSNWLHLAMQRKCTWERDRRLPRQFLLQYFDYFEWLIHPTRAQQLRITAKAFSATGGFR